MSAGRSGGRPLVLCADDYGMNRGVNGAILELGSAGRISATSCMTNAPGWPEAAGSLPRPGGGMACGLHLTLSWGGPLGPMPRFAPGGAFPPLGRVMRAALLGRLPVAEIAAEVGRQFDAFGDALGRPPDFIDGHQHVHVLPGIRAILLAEAARRGWMGRVWFRDPSDRVVAILRRRVGAPKALLVAALSSGFGAAAGRAGFGTNDGFAGFSPFDPRRDLAREMGAFLTDLGSRPLVMCHPARPCPDSGADAIAASRLREFALLSSDAFTDLLAERGLRLVQAPVEPF